MHGEVPLAMYNEAVAEFNGEEYDWSDDELEFVSCQIIFAPQGVNDDGEMQGVLLQVNEEGPLSDTYRYKARNPQAGRGMGQGIQKKSRNTSAGIISTRQKTARAVAVGGKVLFVTDDGDVVDSIYDDGIDHCGTIPQRLRRPHVPANKHTT